jgi:hypothetical protein
MARIAAGQSELRNAFWRHFRQEAAAGYLLLFYSVECGLKSVYLRQNHLRTTAQIQDPELQEKGHDIARWVKELRLPASILQTGREFRLERDGTRHRIETAHQAWRYGVEMQKADEESLLEYLERIQSWIQEALQR